MSLVLTLLLILTAPLVEAKNLYVNNSGSPACSNATTYANNDASNPWCLIGRAAWGSTNYAAPNTGEAAQAGDVVLVTAGTYTETGNIAGGRWDVVLNPANSGSSGNVITFRGVGAVYIRLATTTLGPMIGCDSRNYIVWDHFIIDDTYGNSMYDTGPVVFHVANYCQLINSEVLGHNDLLTYQAGHVTYTANYPVIRLEATTFITVKNNTIHRVHNRNTGSGGENDEGIQTYDTDDAIIEHNEIYDCGQAIGVKGDSPAQLRNIVRYNYIHGNGWGGIRVQVADDTLIHQNVVVSSGRGLMNGHGVSNRSRFVNNTLYGNTYGVRPMNADFVDAHFKNNIIIGGTYAIYDHNQANPSAHSMTFDRNFYNGASSAHARYNDDFGGVNISFATWQGTYSEDTNGVNGTDPLFVNGGGSFALATDFKLQGASTALTLGRVVESIGGTNGDTIPAGAYITGNEEIGIETGATSNRRFSPAFLRRASYEVEP